MPVDITEPQETKADEPATEPAADEGRADETKEVAGEAKEEVAADASAESSKDVFDAQPPKGLEKEHKALRDAWLKKNSEAADRIRMIEEEKVRITQELDRKNRLMEELAVRNAAPVKTPEPEPMPEFQDLAQMTRYLEDRATKKAEARAEAIVQGRLSQIEQKKAYEDRWANGWSSVAEKDKTMVTQDPEFQTLVRNELMNPHSPYLKHYNGKNEAEVIQRTVDGIRSIAEKYAAAAKQSVIADMKRKTTVATERPAKAVTIGKDPRAMSKAEIIAEMRAELGAES